MTPTDKLRTLLDERGIEHDDNDANMEVIGVRITKWDNGGKREVRYEEWRNGTTRLDAGNMSPEQAISATVGANDASTLQAKVKAQSDYISKLRGEYKALGEQMERHCVEYRATIRRLKVELDTATVGAGTCKLVDNEHGPDMHCTACGGEVDDEYRYFMDSWGYSRCPHCGARIIEEETE